MNVIKIEIQKYTPGLLKKFIESPEYHAMPVIPVSYHRAVSWLNNPNLDPGDVIMYLAIENNVMTGYRCILPDKLGTVRFGWLSGNWVDPARRREGIATRLFEEAMKDWNNKLMYTNYAPASHAVYDKTGCFKLYYELSGIRAYLRFDLARLLYPRGKFFTRIKLLLKALDYILNFFNDFRLMMHRKRYPLPVSGLQFINEISHQLEDFISTVKADYCIFRRPKELSWIIHFPWVVEQQRKDDLNRRYFFTSAAKQYENLNLKLSDMHDQLILYMMLVMIDKKMTVPYFFYNSSHADKAVDIILSLMFEKQVNYITLFNPELVGVFCRRELPFLYKKKMTRKYFATRDLIALLPPAEKIFIQDGDGDVAFT